jgi:hypothetical protein
MKAIYSTLGDIVYFSLLLILFMFILTLLGEEWFANDIKVDKDNNPMIDGDFSYRLNFNNFTSGLITVFALLVGED